ncbi:MAG: glycosyltransferase [Prevotellaceae bacterium]|jgi:glycosyltransferase involved in cell wall biosynthesis|nr:glycosyltransferase [Prevotellaceae bacterium]
MKLSVIICTYNREKYIYNVLKSIAENAFPHGNYELLVIDNNSSDDTALECKRFHAGFPDVVYRYYVEPNQGLSYARNRGVKEAAGDILIYVDDDATVNAGYLQACYSFFAQYPSAMAAGGPVIPVYETEKPRWLSHFTIPLITGYFYKGGKIKAFKKSGFPRGGNAAYRKTVFDKTGYFNVQLGRKGNNLTGAEEKDIFDKMRAHGMPFYYLPGAILYHIIPASKLTGAYFNTLTVAMGRSEQLRTRAISRRKYTKRLLIEAAKWVATIGLCAGYSFLCTPQKGWKLLLFRWNVTKGLLT